jgi:hypothetical protein
MAIPASKLQPENPFLFTNHKRVLLYSPKISIPSSKIPSALNNKHHSFEEDGEACCSVFQPAHPDYFLASGDGGIGRIVRW